MVDFMHPSLLMNVPLDPDNPEGSMREIEERLIPRREGEPSLEEVKRAWERVVERNYPDGEWDLAQGLLQVDGSFEEAYGGLIERNARREWYPMLERTDGLFGNYTVPWQFLRYGWQIACSYEALVAPLEDPLEKPHQLQKEAERRSPNLEEISRRPGGLWDTTTALYVLSHLPAETAAWLSEDGGIAHFGRLSPRMCLAAHRAGEHPHLQSNPGMLLIGWPDPNHALDTTPKVVGRLISRTGARLLETCCGADIYEAAAQTAGRHGPLGYVVIVVHGIPGELGFDPLWRNDLRAAEVLQHAKEAPGAFKAAFRRGGAVVINSCYGGYDLLEYDKDGKLRLYPCIARALSYEAGKDVTVIATRSCWGAKSITGPRFGLFGGVRADFGGDEISFKNGRRVGGPDYSEALIRAALESPETIPPMSAAEREKHLKLLGFVSKVQWALNTFGRLAATVMSHNLGALGWWKWIREQLQNPNTGNGVRMIAADVANQMADLAEQSLGEAPPENQDRLARGAARWLDIADEATRSTGMGQAPEGSDGRREYDRQQRKTDRLRRRLEAFQQEGSAALQRPPPLRAPHGVLAGLQLLTNAEGFVRRELERHPPEELARNPGPGTLQYLTAMGRLCLDHSSSNLLRLRFKGTPAMLEFTQRYADALLTATENTEAAPGFVRSAHYLRGVAAAYAARGQPSETERDHLLEEAQLHFQQARANGGVNGSKVNIAYVARREGRIDEARQLLQEVLDDGRTPAHISRAARANLRKIERGGARWRFVT
jgi:hypothetical protein